MYKLLLAWRYLRTRFIALASIVSVTLGVATLIVVNSVMAGFVEEMKDRLHGILSDVEIASPGLGEIEAPEFYVQEIKDLLGDELKAVTYVTRVPALMSFEFRGHHWTQQIMLMGIDEATYGQVTEFLPFMLNESKREKISFQLEENGYDARFDGIAGWPYRRTKFENQKKMAELMRMHQANYDQSFGPQYPASNDDSQLQATNLGDQIPAQTVIDPPQESVARRPGEFHFVPLPQQVPNVERVITDKMDQMNQLENGVPTAFDPNTRFRDAIPPDQVFDPAKHQHTGIILGLAISNRKYADVDTGEVKDLFMLRPGDDIQVTLPTGGSNPSPVMENCTVVDFYCSNMHEYDSSFAFMPLKELQQLRGMINPVTGASTVSSIQIKVKDGADLAGIRDRLNAKFPPHVFPWVIQTWQDTQRPLLSAVHLELTILNILLFMIIAVAGFGILATFYMIVVEKTKDIGILKALGAPSGGVMSIFLGYGFSLGTVGAGVGIVLGLLFVSFINEIADLVQQITGQEIFDPTIYYFNEIPTIVSPHMVVLVAFGAIVIAVLASILPALRAARLHPVEALRYE